MHKPNSGKKQTPRPVAPCANWLRFPINVPLGQCLRVLIYARYSTDEQNPHSIEAQIAFVKRFLEFLNITDVTFEVIFDEGVSGEQLFRPGIDKVRAVIAARRCDIIIVEDSSRLFRNQSGCMELVGSAVDQGIRTICIGDEVDTADEAHWEERLYEATRHHATSNRYAAARIKRTLLALWESGAAIGLLKPGYLRVPMEEVVPGQTNEGPKEDFIDPIWLAAIVDIFRRIAAREGSWAVAQVATAAELPKTGNSKNPAWTDVNIRALIRSLDYRGVQRYQLTVSKKKYGTGKHLQVRNEPEQVLYRDMPHLRMVSDELWLAANQVLDEESHGVKRISGIEHPLAGIPRDSRGPLSKTFVCVCVAKMIIGGRSVNAYGCSRIPPHGSCWNKATAKRQLTHDRIRDALLFQLDSLGNKRLKLIDTARELLGDQAHSETRRQELVHEITELSAQMDRLTTAIELADVEIAELVDKLKLRKASLNKAKADLQALSADKERLEIPTLGEIDKRIEELRTKLHGFDRSVQDDLKSLVGQIVAVPCLQHATQKVVLRAKFTLRLANLLPARTRAALAGLYDEAFYNRFESISITVDLFDPSTGPKYGLAAVELKESGLGLTAIGMALGINKRCAHIAVQYGEAMRAAGLTDPFIELSEAPTNASRWRNPKWLRPGDVSE